MPGEITQFRELPYGKTKGGDVSDVSWTSRDTEGRISSGDWHEYMMGDQTTTSYRSRPTDVEPTALTPGMMMAQANASKGSDNGHAFFTRKREKGLSHPHWTISSSTSLARYTGPIVPKYAGGWGYWPTVPSLTQNEINYYGSRLIGKCIPTHPAAPLATMIGELVRDPFPDIAVLFNPMRDKADFFRNLGGKYLNAEFGWKPFVSDLNKILWALLDSSRILHQYQRDSGRYIRRDAGFPWTVTNEFTEDVNQSTSAVFMPWDVEAQLKVPFSTATATSLTRHREVRYWFAGAFTYYLESPIGILGKLERYEQLANKLLGIRITPDVLWELTPWSWLLDWFTNISTFMGNVSAFSQDGLVMRYGYLMRETHAVDTYTSAGHFFKDGDPGPVTLQLSVVQKERVKATPFGFGLNPDIDFSVRQWAILAALGLTRAPSVAR
jgi:hypothetical protein